MTPTESTEERRCDQCGATDSNHHVMCNNCSLWWPYIAPESTEPAGRSEEEALAEVNALATLMFETWQRVDPSSGVAEFPASYMSNFADMARTVLAAGYRKVVDK